MVSLSFTDILDILIVASILYLLYKLIKGTVAINIFAGIFIFYVAWLLVRALNMELISTILGQFIGVGVIALLIVFQQEVRRFLLLLGSKYNLHTLFGLERFLGKTSMKDETVEAIVNACDYFSKTKTGALIVLTQHSALYNYAQTGVLIKSEVVEELLENIFFKNTPLHDGAVIIAENKILAARCILPVSDNMNIPGSLGLRHRAAIGMSAATDAHIVVVSEETGNISFVKDGAFKVRISPEELKRFLHNDFTGFVVNR